MLKILCYKLHKYEAFLLYAFANGASRDLVDQMFCHKLHKVTLFWFCLESWECPKVDENLKKIKLLSISILNKFRKITLDNGCKLNNETIMFLTGIFLRTKAIVALINVGKNVEFSRLDEFWTIVNQVTIPWLITNRKFSGTVS